MQWRPSPNFFPLFDSGDVPISVPCVVLSLTAYAPAVLTGVDGPVRRLTRQEIDAMDLRDVAIVAAIARARRKS